MVVNILLALLVLSVIVIVHEFGHLIVAKANGITVVEFAIGFGPNLFHVKIGETDYCLKLLPFGGACVMLGNDFIESQIDDDEDEDEPNKVDEDYKTASGFLTEKDGEDYKTVSGYLSEKAKQKAIERGYNLEKSFNSKSVWARIAVIAAGPIFNFILAFVLSIVVIGSVGYDPCTVDAVYDNSPASSAGLLEGDKIVKVNGRKITFYRDYYFYRYFHADNDMDITYIRDGKKYTTKIEPEYIKQSRYLMGIMISKDCVIDSFSDDSAAKEAGIEEGDIIISIDGTEISENSMVTKLLNESEGKELRVTVLRDGEKKEFRVTPRLSETESYYTGFDCYGSREKVSSIDTIKYSFAEVGYNVRSVVESLGMMFTGKVGINDLSGPVGAVSMMSDVVEESKSDGAFYVFLNLLNLGILISANLGVMNLLPIPGLDGGKLIFLFYEAVRGKPVDRKYEGVITLVGVIFLVILTIYLLFKDIFSLF
ncbi:MAG: RIP metalloprotease RseP [Lachnospira sp.]